MHPVTSVTTSLFLCCVALNFSPRVSAEDQTLSTFQTQQLSDVYFSEGASAGDINGDGAADVVCGPYWYEGPEFNAKHEIYPPVPQPLERYADNFFSWIYDFDGDGHNDVFAVGFPGTPAYVYQNPGKQSDAHWKKHQVIDWVSNESPQFLDFIGDETPELVCTRDGFFGFATLNTEEPFGSWTFHPISEQIAPPRFGHGLGVGDINGDARTDLIFSGGWFEQPESEAATKRWKLHPQSFSKSYGGAEMYAYDVDGDGDNDVITSHAAHDFGLGWYEQTAKEGNVSFRHHQIMGDRPEQNKYGVVFSELHSVQLVDVDGDGLRDIVTGKTFWSHHRQSPMWDADPVVYWFRLVRADQGVDWVPYQAGKTSGIGRQITVHDVDQDGAPDFVVGGMKGTAVLKQTRRKVDTATWSKNQPAEFVSTGKRADRGESPVFEGSQIVGAIEGEAMKVAEISGGKTSVQGMSGFKSGKWSDNKQLFWTGIEPRARLTLEFEVTEAGEYEVGAVLTTARDYGIVNLQLDGLALGTAVDLYDYPHVGTTGHLTFGKRSLKTGKHKLRIEMTGANDSAVKSYMVGLDCLTLNRK